ncbi:MAG: hypothetical protein RQ715_02180 [Methylococcales bacterium]|nr:hypothetical protein [Methylococcales bacterium]
MKIFSNGGEDTVGSLGGDDQTFGGAGNDVVYGGADHDRLDGGTGNDRLNGGFGFDLAIQSGSLDDYDVQRSDNLGVTLTHNVTGEIDTFTDVEQIVFANGAALNLAHNEAEAVAHHLVTTWLGRDLTQQEGAIVQTLTDNSADDLANLFRDVLAPDAVKTLSNAELLEGLDTNANLVRLDVNRSFIGSDNDERGQLPRGLAWQIDGGEGFDVLDVNGARSDVHLTDNQNQLELTHFDDGAMLSLSNAEAIAYADGDSTLLARNAVEGVLGRLVQTYLNRDASVEEWQLGLELVQDPANYRPILDWFNDQAQDLNSLDNAGFIQAVFQNTLGRNANTDERDGLLDRLNNGDLDRDGLAIELAAGDEAIAAVGSVLQFDGWV